jgi:lysophospholipase L1-like esterase
MRKRVVRTASCVLAAVSATLLSMLAPAAPAGAGGTVFDPPKQYYLSLGDSITFGLQVQRFLDEIKGGTYDPASFPGFTVELTADFAQLRPGIVNVNYACPGQDTTDFVSKPCGFAQSFALHNAYTGTQLDAATAFLNAHRGQVSPVSLDIGAADLANLLNGCKFKTDCVTAALPAVLATVRTNLTTILTTLRSAAPDTEIIVLQMYDAFAVDHPETAAAYVQLNQVIAADAAAAGATVADSFTAFNLAPDEPATLCALTLYCPHRDTHPSDAGYHVLAEVFLKASGYHQP